MDFYAPMMNHWIISYEWPVFIYFFLLKRDKTGIFTKTTGRPENTKKDGTVPFKTVRMISLPWCPHLRHYIALYLKHKTALLSAQGDDFACELLKVFALMTMKCFCLLYVRCEFLSQPTRRIINEVRLPYEPRNVRLCLGNRTEDNSWNSHRDANTGSTLKIQDDSK
jgi:hypothetical protein